MLAGNHSSKYSFDMFTHLRPTLDNPNWSVNVVWYTRLLLTFLQGRQGEAERALPAL